MLLSSAGRARGARENGSTCFLGEQKSDRMF